MNHKINKNIVSLNSESIFLFLWIHDTTIHILIYTLSIHITTRDIWTEASNSSVKRKQSGPAGLKSLVKF